MLICTTGAWSTIKRGFSFVHVLRASFVTPTVLTIEMELMHCVEITSLRSRSRHADTYTILPSLLSLVSSSNMTGLSLPLSQFLSLKSFLEFEYPMSH